MFVWSHRGLRRWRSRRWCGLGEHGSLGSACVDAVRTHVILPLGVRWALGHLDLVSGVFLS